MNPDAQQSFDTWIKFACAVKYVADVERADLTIGVALAEALGEWSDDGRFGNSSGEDRLRSVLEHVMQATPLAGAPGGMELVAVLDAAMTDWIANASSRVNDGLPFSFC